MFALFVIVFRYNFQQHNRKNQKFLRCFDDGFIVILLIKNVLFYLIIIIITHLQTTPNHTENQTKTVFIIQFNTSVCPSILEYLKDFAKLLILS